MKHTMKLSKVPFDKMVSGSKVIESRIYDEKRQKLKLSDEIEFIQNDNFKNIQRTKIIGLLHYESFHNLFEDQLALFPESSVDGLLNEIYEFLSVEKEQEYGVLGIRIQKID